MGCCYSLFSFFCKDDCISQNAEPNERTQLLIDPVSNNINIQRSNSEDFLNSGSSTTPKKTDEQSAMNRILQETATNVIDVAALDSHNLQQHEYLERMKLYNIRLQQVCTTHRLPAKSRTHMLQDVPDPEKLLSIDPISQEDFNMIRSLVLAAEEAIKNIKIEHREELVVPFLP